MYYSVTRDTDKFKNEWTQSLKTQKRRYAADNIILNHSYSRTQFPWQDFFQKIPWFLQCTKFPDIYLTAIKLPDISRFSRQVITPPYTFLYSRSRKWYCLYMGW